MVAVLYMCLIQSSDSRPPKVCFLMATAETDQSEPQCTGTFQTPAAPHLLASHGPKKIMWPLPKSIRKDNPFVTRPWQRCGWRKE